VSDGRTSSDDDTRRRGTVSRLLGQAPVSRCLIAANVVVFVASLLLSRGDVFSLDARSLFSFLGPSDDVVLFLGVLLPNAVLRDLEVWRLVTSAFLHAGIVHLLFNLLALHSLGPTLESNLGSRPFAIVYMGSALVGSAAELVVNQAGLGASGAIFGLIGAGLALGFRGVGDEDLPRGFRRRFGRWAFYNVIFTFTIPNISIAGHVGGLVGGIVLGFTFAPRSAFAETTRSEARWIRATATALLGLTPASFAAAIVMGFLAPSDTSAPFAMSRWPALYVERLPFRMLDLEDAGAPGFSIDVPARWQDVPASAPEAILVEGRTGMNVMVFAGPAGGWSPRQYLDSMPQEWGGLVPGTGSEGDTAAEGDFRQADGEYSTRVRVTKVEGDRFVVVTSAAHTSVDAVVRQRLFARVADSLRRRQ
jgi:membrane associated rhomboid family serine protease